MIKFGLVAGALLGAGLFQGCSKGGCDGFCGPSEPLTCEVLEGANCYNELLAGLDCLPEQFSLGVLSEDRGRCEYDGGISVRFHQPAPRSLDEVDERGWHFTIQKNGVDCLELKDSQLTQRLTAGNEVVEIGTDGKLGMRLSCGDGPSYTTSNGLGLLSCNSFFYSTYSASDDSVELSFGGLEGAGVGEPPVSSRQLFNCATEQRAAAP